MVQIKSMITVTGDWHNLHYISYLEYNISIYKITHSLKYKNRL